MDVVWEDTAEAFLTESASVSILVIVDVVWEGSARLSGVCHVIEFQSLLLWMWSGKFQWFSVFLTFFLVSILVIVDVVWEVSSCFINALRIAVSILVIVDVVWEECRPGSHAQKWAVSILVIVDVVWEVVG